MIELISMLFFLAAISCLFTESCKRIYKQEGKNYNNNIVALANAILVGGLGSFIYMVAVSAFVWYFIPVAIAYVWVGSMIGYDKITQTLHLGGSKQ